MLIKKAFKLEPGQVEAFAHICEKGNYTVSFELKDIDFGSLLFLVNAQPWYSSRAGRKTISITEKDFSEKNPNIPNMLILGFDTLGKIENGQYIKPSCLIGDITLEKVV